MSFCHPNYFPFCIGTEQIGSNGSVQMPLQDAMAIYWKAKRARLELDFEWTAHLGSVNTGTAPNQFTRAAVDIDEENGVFDESDFLGRVCISPVLAITGSDSDQYGSTDVLVQIFTDAGDFPRVAGTYPVLPSSNVSVHVRAAVSTSGYYSAMVLRNLPLYQDEPTYTVPLVLVVNGNSYTLNTSAQFLGYPYADSGGPDGPSPSFSDFRITFS